FEEIPAARGLILSVLVVPAPDADPLRLGRITLISPPHQGKPLRSSTDASAVLLAIDLAGEGMPAARLVKCEIVLLAEQQGEAHRLVGAHGCDGRPEREAGIAPAAAVLAGHDAADAADMDPVPVPADRAEIDADMAGKPVVGRIDQHAQIRMRPFDMAPGQ